MGMGVGDRAETGPSGKRVETQRRAGMGRSRRRNAAWRRLAWDWQGLLLEAGLAVERLIVVGTSTGGVQALRTLVAGLPADLPAALLVVMHIDGHASYLPEILARHSHLPVRHARDGETIEAGVYVAPPDCHLLVHGDQLRLVHGPKEHFTRPAVDPLFRSAASEHGRRVIGVVLTGNLNDGTLGLRHIKQCGGMTVVQDPQDAEAPGMPMSAWRNVDVDSCVPLERMPQLLIDMVRGRAAAPGIDRRPMADGLARADTPEGAAAGQDDPACVSARDADRSPFVCPVCHGSLAAVAHTQPTEFDCYTGHRFTLETLVHAQAQTTDDQLWSAYRALKEREMLLRLRAEQTGPEALAGGGAELAADIARTARSAEILLELTGHLPTAVVGAE